MGFLNVVQETKTKKMEMSASNHLMSPHVLQQAQHIKLLYDQVVKATKDVERGNKELSQACSSIAVVRPFICLLAFRLEVN